MDTKYVRLVDSVLPPWYAKTLTWISWYGGTLDDSFRRLATLTACTMLLEKKGSATFAEEWGEGVIKTEGKRISVGAISGIIFTGTYNHRKSGKGEISFLLNDRDEESLLKYIRSQLIK